jgi:hypothetical protein
LNSETIARNRRNLRCTPRLDAEQTTTLNFLALPMLQMNCAALRNQIEQGLMIELAKFGEFHRNDAMFNRQSKISN